MRPCQRVLMVLCLVASAGARASDSDPPVIFHRALGQAPKGKAIEIVAEIKDPAGVFGPTLYFRRTGTGTYATASLIEVAGKFVATIPAGVVTEDVEYFLEAFDNEGNGPARMGSSARPLRIKVTVEAAAARPETKPPPPPEKKPPETKPPPPPETKVAAAKKDDDPDWSDDAPRKVTVVPAKTTAVPLPEERKSGSGAKAALALGGGAVLVAAAVVVVVILLSGKGPVVNEVDVTVQR